jgi:peptide/nickel transport system ATP-binding protein
MLEADGLALALPDRAQRRPFRRAPLVPILRGIDLRLAAGESLGIVGESGSGKTSLGRTLIRLYRPTAGRLRFENRDITDLAETELRPLRERMQFIFQDPLSALNPRQRIGTLLTRPLVAFGRAGSAASARAQAANLLERVGLSEALLDRFPHQLSGGQRQRIGIARAIALAPRLVVADEITSGLDVSTQAQILTLLRTLKRDLGLALIFISHDLSTVRILCDRVLVLRQGEAVETGPCAELFAAPRHPYTRMLLDSIPLPEIDPGWLDRSSLSGS